MKRRGLLVGVAGAWFALAVFAGSADPEPAASWLTGVAIADHRERESLRWLVFGDSGTGKPDQQRVGRLMARVCAMRGGCDFALMAGDNIYPMGARPPMTGPDRRLRHDPAFETKFERAYAELGRLDLWAVPGNHDGYMPGSIESEIAYTRASPRWRMPARDYALPRLPPWLHVYALDTTSIARGRGSDVVERARLALCGAAGWRLVFGHHPAYSSGHHADADGAQRKVVQALVEPLIERCGVQVYFAGHEHHQEHLSAPGFEQIVQGAAAKLREVRRIAERPPGVEQIAAASRLGFALVEARPQHLELRFIGLGDDGEPETLHCRAFQLEQFAERRTRWRPCAVW